MRARLSLVSANDCCGRPARVPSSRKNATEQRNIDGDGSQSLMGDGIALARIEGRAIVVLSPGLLVAEAQTAAQKVCLGILVIEYGKSGATPLIGRLRPRILGVEVEVSLHAAYPDVRIVLPGGPERAQLPTPAVARTLNPSAAPP